MANDANTDGFVFINCDIQGRKAGIIAEGPVKATFSGGRVGSIEGVGVTAPIGSNMQFDGTSITGKTAAFHITKPDEAYSAALHLVHNLEDSLRQLENSLTQYSGTISTLYDLKTSLKAKEVWRSKYLWHQLKGFITAVPKEYMLSVTIAGIDKIITYLMATVRH